MGNPGIGANLEKLNQNIDVLGPEALQTFSNIKTADKAVKVARENMGGLTRTLRSGRVVPVFDPISLQQNLDKAQNSLLQVRQATDTTTKAFTEASQQLQAANRANTWGTMLSGTSILASNLASMLKIVEIAHREYRNDDLTTLEMTQNIAIEIATNHKSAVVLPLLFALTPAGFTAAVGTAVGTLTSFVSASAIGASAMAVASSVGAVVIPAVQLGSTVGSVNEIWTTLSTIISESISQVDVLEKQIEQSLNMINQLEQDLKNNNVLIKNAEEYINLLVPEEQETIIKEYTTIQLEIIVDINIYKTIHNLAVDKLLAIAKY